MATLRVLTAGAVVAFAVGVPVAHAASQQPVGLGCGFMAGSGFEGYTQGSIYGGPVAAPGSTISLRCSIHVDNRSYTGPAAVSVSTPPSQSVAFLPPMEFGFASDGELAICSEAIVDDTTWYRTTSGEWTTDATVLCGLARSVPPGSDCLSPLACLVDEVEGLLPQPLKDALGHYADGCVDAWLACVIDNVVCEQFRILAPGLPGIVDIRPDGDVYLVGYGFFWDCPPYEGS